jgi:hypothetical protein
MKKIFSVLSLSLVILSTIFIIGCFGITNVAGKTYAYDSFNIRWLSEEDKNRILYNQTEEEFLISMETTLTNMYGNLLIIFNEDGSVTLKNAQTQQTIETSSYVQENNKVYIYENEELVTTYYIEKNKFYYEQERDIDDSGEPELILKLYFKQV